MSKAGYESIPDVEKGESKSLETAKGKYPELDDKQADLIFTFDEAIASSSLDISLPTTSPDDLVTQGKSFLQGIVSPTLTSLCTMAAAFVLSATAQANALAAMIVPFFPYLNAVVVFASSFKPIQDRFMSAVEPVFTQVDTAEGKVKKSVDDVGTNVDATIDSLQAKVGDVLKPMEPTLKKAKLQTGALKKLDPELEVPDLDDVNKEFDEMQGVVVKKIEEAEEHLVLDKYIPAYLQSADSFYWRIVFPVAVVALLIQLAFAWFTTYSTSAANEAGRLLKDVDVQSYKDEASDQIHGYQDEASGQIEGFRDELRDQFKTYSDEFNELSGSLKPMLINVATSYAVALVQMGLIYLCTNPKVRAWIVNKLLSMMKDEAMRTLRQYGAVTTVEDVMGTRMSRIRSKVLKILQVYQKVNDLMGKLGGVSDLAAMATQRPQLSIETDKKPSFIGRILGQTPRSPTKKK